jgi:hypothetical protein
VSSMASNSDGRTKILFTGGSGCLSAAIIQKLLSDNPKDLHCVRFDPQIPNDLVSGKYVQGSVTDKGSIIAACNLTGTSVLVHLAGWNQFDFDSGKKNREDFFHLNVKGTFQVLEALPRTKCGKLLYISSTSANDSNSVSGWACLTCENMIRHYASVNDLEVIILRIAPCTPPYDRSNYRDNYLRWCHDFWTEGVHIDDAVDACIKGVRILINKSVTKRETMGSNYPPVLKKRIMPIVVAGHVGCTREEYNDWVVQMKSARIKFSKRSVELAMEEKSTPEISDVPARLSDKGDIEKRSSEEGKKTVMDEENDDLVVEETKTLSNIEEAEDDAESLPPTPTTIMEASEMYFAQIFSEELLKTAKLHSFDLNILPRWIDCIAAQKILGWTPHFSKISMFQELEKYSELGPERPEWASKGVQQGFTNDDGVEIGMTKKQK